MSRDAASVTMVGRAGTHPQYRREFAGDRVSLRVVATERWFDKAANDWVDGDEFGVTVVCWKGLGGAVLNTVRKGDPVIVVTGRITTRRFEKDGATAVLHRGQSRCRRPRRGQDRVRGSPGVALEPTARRQTPPAAPTASAAAGRSSRAELSRNRVTTVSTRDDWGDQQPADRGGRPGVCRLNAVRLPPIGDLVDGLAVDLRIALRAGVVSAGDRARSARRGSSGRPARAVVAPPRSTRTVRSSCRFSGRK